MWQLASVDGKVSMDVNAAGNGGVNGSMNIDGLDYSVNGNWAASHSVPGRNYSNFAVTGSHATSPGVPNLLAAAGIMDGPGAWPNNIKIAGNVAPSSVAGMRNFSETLLPVMNTDQNALNSAYAASYAVLRIAGDVSACVGGWLGQVNANGETGTLNNTYQTSGVALVASQLAAVVTPDPTNSDLHNINVPHFKSAEGTRPVMIQFLGPMDHYGNMQLPPLAEAHPSVQKIFYDTTTQALVLQFLDKWPSLPSSQVINFNHGRSRQHTGVIIRPN